MVLRGGRTYARSFLLAATEIYCREINVTIFMINARPGIFFGPHVELAREVHGVTELAETLRVVNAHLVRLCAKRVSSNI